VIYCIVGLGVGPGGRLPGFNRVGGHKRECEASGRQPTDGETAFWAGIVVSGVVWPAAVLAFVLYGIGRGLWSLGNRTGGKP
jgi:hypothetical protein